MRDLFRAVLSSAGKGTARVSSSAYMVRIGSFLLIGASTNASGNMEEQLFRTARLSFGIEISLDDDGVAALQKIQDSLHMKHISIAVVTHWTSMIYHRLLPQNDWQTRL